MKRNRGAESLLIVRSLATPAPERTSTLRSTTPASRPPPTLQPQQPRHCRHGYLISLPHLPVCRRSIPRVLQPQLQLSRPRQRHQRPQSLFRPPQQQQPNRHFLTLFPTLFIQNRHLDRQILTTALLQRDDTLETSTKRILIMSTELKTLSK